MSQAPTPRSAQRTQRVVFDEIFKTFRLYAGNSLYAFCLSPELSLEHLYWGKTLHDDYDLRYLSQSSRKTHFSTAEVYEKRAAAEADDDLQYLQEAETIEDLMEFWKRYRHRGPVSVKRGHDLDVIQQKRIENMSWRMMAKTQSRSLLNESEDSQDDGYFIQSSLTPLRPPVDVIVQSLGTGILPLGLPPDQMKQTTGIAIIADEGDQGEPVCETRGSSYASARFIKTSPIDEPTELAFGTGPGRRRAVSSGPMLDTPTARLDPASASAESVMSSPSRSTARRMASTSRLATHSREVHTAFSPGTISQRGTLAADDIDVRARHVTQASALAAGEATQRNLSKSGMLRIDPGAQPLPMFPRPPGSKTSPAGSPRRRPLCGAPFASPRLTTPPGGSSGGGTTSSSGSGLSSAQHSRSSAERHHKGTKSVAFERSGGAIGKGTLCVEYSDHGTGDFRSPSFSVIDNTNGSSIAPLRYRRHHIYRGKLPMPDGLPGIRSSGDNDASTLVVTMADIGSGLEVDLIYTVMHEYDVITRRVVFRNVDTRRQKPLGAGKVIQRACSMTLDFESTTLPFYLVQLSGSWARERYIVETKLTHGTQSFGSTRGVSGHQHNPFAVITIGTPSETQGEARGFSLIYSGNFLFEADLGEMGRLRLNMGIHPMGLQWHLKPGAVFNTPEAVLVRSNQGLGGISRTLHRLFLDKLMPKNWADVGPPPVLLNTWEAKYFSVNHADVVEMAKQASRIGIDMIVLDDGWFGTRNDDMSSLGDWIPDLSKFPHGIRGLAEDVNAAGCKFGLWFEPEMVSEDSQLHRMHPDWYLRVPGRPRQVGRNQFVLDLSRREVCEYLFGALSAILSTANVEYVKWDMNRPLTEVFSQRGMYSQLASVDASVEGEMGTVSSVWQSETSHRYVLGLYQLLDRVVKAFPHVLLETCSSGGGRFDPGMLYYGSQIWCSDNTDAVVRMKVQYGTSLAYPARCIGAHISTAPNHITGNTTRTRTRGFVAMCGTFGFELDISTASVGDKLVFRELISCYKSIAHIIRRGDLYRLWDPFKVSLASWMYVARDKSEAVVFAFSLNSDHWSNLVPRLVLQGLDPDVEYEITEPMPNNMAQSTGNLRIIETEVPIHQLGFPSVILTGEILMNAGLPVKFYTLDDSIMFKLTRVSLDEPLPSSRSRQNSFASAEGNKWAYDDHYFKFPSPPETVAPALADISPCSPLTQPEASMLGSLCSPNAQLSARKRIDQMATSTSPTLASIDKSAAAYLRAVQEEQQQHASLTQTYPSTAYTALDSVIKDD